MTKHALRDVRKIETQKKKYYSQVFLKILLAAPKPSVAEERKTPKITMISRVTISYNDLFCLQNRRRFLRGKAAESGERLSSKCGKGGRERRAVSDPSRVSI